MTSGNYNDKLTEGELEALGALALSGPTTYIAPEGKTLIRRLLREHREQRRTIEKLQPGLPVNILMDRNEDGEYEAWFMDDKSQNATGKTTEEAIGILVHDHQHELGIKIEIETGFCHFTEW